MRDALWGRMASCGRLVIGLAGCAMWSAAAQRGILLEDLSWVEAQQVLKPDTVVVLPLGAESKEHGPHLKLKNDWLMAEYLGRAVLQRADVVVAPTLNYGYYPAFLEYPGSTSLRLETSRDMVVDICRTLAHYGPRRFYILNTGVSTAAALRPAQATLEAEGIAMRFTNILTISEKAEQAVRQSQGGTHADEIETSIMLYIAPDSVDMRKAVKDYHPGKQGGLSRDPKTAATYSASGVFGDATLATRAKGEIVVKAMIEGILGEIEALRRTALR